MSYLRSVGSAASTPGPPAIARSRVGQRSDSRGPLSTHFGLVSVIFGLGLLKRATHKESKASSKVTWSQP